MKKIVLIVIVLLLSLQSLFLQENLGIPPSPTVASLVTVEKDSVNSSGKIVHNISLWDMTLGEHSFPMSRSYSSSGIKIEETPSYVGTGRSDFVFESTYYLPTLQDVENNIKQKAIYKISHVHLMETKLVFS